MEEIKKFKNIVIGAGPAGRLGSFELGKLGEETLLIEKKYIAGTCLNEGCMVVCALTDISRFIRNFKRFTEIGFIDGNISLDYKSACDNIKKTQLMLRRLNQEKNKDYNIYEAENLLIATGARPFIPNIDGAKYALTSSDVLSLKEVPSKLNIVGGGIIATELSNLFSSFGSEVKIIARSEILKDLEPEIKSYVVNKLIDEVDIHENTNVLEITENSIITDKGEFEGKTLIATGRVPNSEIVADIVDLNEDGSIKVNEFFQTSNPNIYAAGDVTGGITLTPYARKEGISAARSMAGYLNKFDDINVPQSLTLDLDVSFTQKASKSEKSDEDSDNVEDVIIPGLGGPHAFWRILRGETGLTKISLNTETEEIVRASQISPSSIDDTAYLAFLMNMGITKEDFDDFLEVHPSTDAYYKILKIM